jgi:hypothetical protein
MVRVDLKDRLAAAHATHHVKALTGLFHDALHVQAHILNAGDQAGRGVGQSVTDADFADFVRQHVLNLLQHGFKVFADFFLMLLFFFAVEFIQIQLAFGDGLQMFVVVVGQAGNQPFVYAVGQ